MPRNLSETRGRSTKLRIVWCGGAISPCRGEQEQVVGDIATGQLGQGLKTKDKIKYDFLACHAKKVPPPKCQHLGGEGRHVGEFKLLGRWLKREGSFSRRSCTGSTGKSSVSKLVTFGPKLVTF